MVRRRQRLATGLTILLAMAMGTAAVAQTRNHAKPKPKPAVVDAGADIPYGDEAVPAPTASASATPAPSAVVDAGGPVPHADIGDGGVRPSPLNPAPNEMPGPPGALPASATGADYDKLLADIAALRARVAAVGDNLFVSRIGIAVETRGSHSKAARFIVSLDDGVVYTAPALFRPEDAVTVYEHAVAPGRHAVTLDVDRRDDRDDSFRTSQRSRFIVDVPKDQRLTVALRIDDDSNMGADFPADRSGKYDLRVRMKASAAPVGAKK